MLDVSDKVEKFIQEYINEIDTDLAEVYRIGFDELSYGQFQELNGIFKYAGIDYKKAQYDTLNFLVTMAIEDWYSGEGGVSQMPLKLFIDLFLSNRLGLYMDEVTTYIYNNRHEWNDEVEIFIENNQPVIKKKI